MSHQHPRGPIVPDAGDDILEGIEKMVSTSGVIRTVNNPAEADVIIADAIAKGTPPSLTNPMFFYLWDWLFVNDGNMNDAGSTRGLRPAVQIWCGTTRGQLSGEVTLSAGQYKQVCSMAMDTTPYDRVVWIIGNMWGQNASGSKVDIEVWGSSTIKARSRLGEWDQSVSAQCMGVVPANTIVEASMWLRGAPGGSRVTVSADEWTNLSYIAFPDGHAKD